MKSVGVFLFLLCFLYQAGCLFFVVVFCSFLCVSVGAWTCVMFVALVAFLMSVLITHAIMVDRL